MHTVPRNILVCMPANAETCLMLKPCTIRLCMLTVQKVAAMKYAMTLRQVVGDRGIAIGLTPSEGVVPPGGVFTCFLTCCNDMCGDYVDFLHVQVGLSHLHGGLLFKKEHGVWQQTSFCQNVLHSSLAFKSTCRSGCPSLSCVLGS